MLWSDQPLWFLLWLQDALSNKHHQILEEKGLLLDCPGNSMAHCDHTERLLIERARERERTGLRLCFLLGLKVGFRVSRAHFLLMNLNIRDNLKHRKRKKEKTAQIVVVTLSVDGNVLTWDSFLCSGCLSNQSLS